jgi:hypothetical protein
VNEPAYEIDTFRGLNSSYPHDRKWVLTGGASAGPLIIRFHVEQESLSVNNTIADATASADGTAGANGSADADGSRSVGAGGDVSDDGTEGSGGVGGNSGDDGGLPIIVCRQLPYTDNGSTPVDIEILDNVRLFIDGEVRARYARIILCGTETQ